MVRLPIPVCRLVYRCAFSLLKSYSFVRRPNVDGVKCVLTNGDRVLLVRHTYGHRSWDLPGGKIKRGEPPTVAASREMREEVGVSVQRWEAFGMLRAYVNYRHDTMYCFQADIAGQQTRMDPCELQAMSWFSQESLPEPLGRFVKPIIGKYDAAVRADAAVPQPGRVDDEMRR